MSHDFKGFFANGIHGIMNGMPVLKKGTVDRSFIHVDDVNGRNTDDLVDGFVVVVDVTALFE